MQVNYQITRLPIIGTFLQIGVTEIHKLRQVRTYVRTYDNVTQRGQEAANIRYYEINIPVIYHDQMH